MYHETSKFIGSIQNSPHPVRLDPEILVSSHRKIGNDCFCDDPRRGCHGRSMKPKTWKSISRTLSRRITYLSRRLVVRLVDSGLRAVSYEAHRECCTGLVVQICKTKWRSFKSSNWGRLPDRCSSNSAHMALAQPYRVQYGVSS